MTLLDGDGPFNYGALMQSAVNTLNQAAEEEAAYPSSPPPRLSLPCGFPPLAHARCPLPQPHPVRLPPPAFLGLVPARFISVFASFPRSFIPPQPPSAPTRPALSGSSACSRSPSVDSAPPPPSPPLPADLLTSLQHQPQPSAAISLKPNLPRGVELGGVVGGWVGGGRGSRGVPKGVMSDVALWLTPGSLAGLPP